MSTIHERFRLVRESLDLSQEAFANKAHRSRSEIKNIEYAKTYPKDDVINAIAAAHGISVTWLTTGEGPMMMPEIDSGMADIDRMLENDDDPVVRRVKRWMGGYFRLSPERRKLAAAILEEIERLQDEQ